MRGEYIKVDGEIHVDDIAQKVSEYCREHYRVTMEIQFTDLCVWGPVERIVNSICENVFGKYIRIYELEEETSWMGWNAVITTLVNVEMKEAVDIVRSVKGKVARIEITRRTARDNEIDYAIQYMG